MKTLHITLAFCVGLAVAGLFAFTQSRQVWDTSKSTAEVQKIQGLYVFTDCTPVTEYESLGTVTLGTGLNGQYVAMRTKGIERVWAKFPNAEGILLAFAPDNTGALNCTAIKFKEPKKKE